MRNPLIVISLCFAFALASSPPAQADFADGLTAAKKGDYPTALKWFSLAAKQGIAQAQFNLGVMYEKGTGVTQDYVQAHMWFNIASANADIKGEKNRNLIAKKMTPSQIENAQKLARDWMEKHQK